MKSIHRIAAEMSGALAALRLHYRDNGSCLADSPALYAIHSAALPEIIASKLFSVHQRNAERSFTEFCVELHCIGIRGKTAILYDDLTYPPITIDAEDRSRIDQEWSRECILSLEKLNKQVADSRERVLGIAGRLVTLPEFLTETAALRLSYEALPKGEKPTWPLVRAWRHSPQVRGKPASPELSEFGRRLKEHLDRWGLMQLADWHLPVSQGMIIPGFMPPGAPAESTHGVSLTVPVQFHLQNCDDIRAMIERAQKEAALAGGLPAESAAISNHRQYAQIFRLHQMEAAFRSRWPEQPSSGSEGLIDLASEALLKLQKPQVRRIRTWMRQLRNGELLTIPSGDR